MEKDTIITVTDVSKVFHVKPTDVEVLHSMTFEVKQGDFLIVFGPSGCGKSTLLHILLGLEIPTTGNIKILGQDIYTLSTEDMRSEFRKEHIGMVYQEPTWIKSLSVSENLIFPLLLLGENKATAVAKAYQLLNNIGMVNWANYLPSDLSSGQQQKISLLRATIANPEIIIADEPTGNLDYESGQEIMKILADLNQQQKTIVMVTHDLEYLQYARSALQMFNGKLIKYFMLADMKALKQSIQGKKLSQSVYAK